MIVFSLTIPKKGIDCIGGVIWKILQSQASMEWYSEVTIAITIKVN